MNDGSGSGQLPARGDLELGAGACVCEDPSTGTSADGEGEARRAHKRPPSTPELEALESAWRAEQERMASLVSEVDGFDADREDLLVGAFDISFPEAEGQASCAALVVCRAPAMEPVYSSMRAVHLDVPYIPGFLAYRELPAYRALWRELLERAPALRPHVLLLDGNGRLHPRAFGSACHVGVSLGVPAIGAAKTFFHVDGMTLEGVRERLRAAPLPPGGWEPLRGDSGRTWGAALRATSEARNPIFVSVGHQVSLETAVAVVRRCCRYRVPEPIRQADIQSRALLRQQPPPAPPPGGPPAP